MRRTAALEKTATFGPAYVPGLDRDRITGQMKRVLDLMLDGEWRTLAEISERTNAPPASASAQIRHLKKARFGNYVVEKRRRTVGTWEYRLSAPLSTGQLSLLEAQ